MARAQLIERQPTPGIRVQALSTWPAPVRRQDIQIAQREVVWVRSSTAIRPPKRGRICPRKSSRRRSAA